MVGSDSPTLPLDYLNEAYQALGAHEVVLGPADDGGYYLVGSRLVVPELWRDIPWGSSSVLEESTRALAAAGRSFHLLPRWYDIDTADDVARLGKELERLEHTPGAPDAPNANDANLPRRTAELVATFLRKGKIPS